MTTHDTRRLEITWWALLVGAAIIGAVCLWRLLAGVGDFGLWFTVFGMVFTIAAAVVNLSAIRRRKGGADRS
jgi:hypothetical protein